MNHKEHVLQELEVSERYAREALQLLCHTIIFLRAPNSIKPKEVHCEQLQLSYAKCDWSASGCSRFEEKVDKTIDACLASLTQAAPELRKGRLTLTFFEKRRTSVLFGLVQNEEKVVFEEWTLPLLIDTSKTHHNAPQHDDTVAVEHCRVQERCEKVVRSCVWEVHSLVNAHLDHLPPVTYQFQLCHGAKRDRGQDLATKIRNSPALINPI